MPSVDSADAYMVGLQFCLEGVSTLLLFMASSMPTTAASKVREACFGLSLVRTCKTFGTACRPPNISLP